MITDEIRGCRIFGGMTDSEIEKIIESDGCCRVSLPRGECYEAQPGIYIVLSGKIKVMKKEDGRELFLRQLAPGDTFGYTCLFAAENDRVRGLLYANSKTQALFIPEQVIMELIETTPRVSLNIISVLTDKIRFLNKKIDSFTSPSGEKRLFKYLLSCPCTDDGGIQIGNMAELARRLDMGRASLYRAFDSLEEGGKITRKDGWVYVNK